MKNNTIILKTGETVHDFRKHKLTWGWNGLSFDVATDKMTAKMLGVGTGIKVGHFIAIGELGNEKGYKVDEITYESNPKDMFTAVVSGNYEFEDGELDN